MTGQEWAQRCREILEENHTETDPFQITLRQARWAITYGPAMMADEERRTVYHRDGTRSVLPYDNISKALHAKCGWPEKAKG